MQVSCPECQTQFMVPDSTLEGNGRKMRCSRCGHKWLQKADGGVEEIPIPQPIPMSREPDFKQADQTLVFKNSDILADLPDDPIDRALKAALSDFEGKDSDDQPNFNSNLLDNDEPIPEVFNSFRTEEEETSSGSKTWLWVLIFLLLSGSGGLYFFREQVVTFWPPAAEYYAMVGISKDNTIGAGLRFRGVDSERVVENDADILLVRGIIANISDSAKQLPLLKLAIHDANDAIVQEKVVAPPEKTLDPGATTGFRIQIENPTALARRFTVTFTLTASPSP